MSELNRPILVLTNDDGVDAPGLRALESALEGMGTRRVVAPLGQHSSGGHAVTTHKAIRIERRADGRIGVEGSPADCVRIALDRIEPELGCVVSGINAGGNLGSDVHYSGTIAAAREAALHGRPAIAVSHYVARGRSIDWERAAAWASAVLADLIPRPWEPGTIWSVNLPHPATDSPFPEVVFCPLDPSPLPLRYHFDEAGEHVRYAGDYHARQRIAGSDVDVCLGGKIAVTLIRIT